MIVHSLHCQEPWFSLLREGKKVVEGRLNKGACRLINLSDQINFYNENASFSLTVTRIQYFATLPEYLDAVGLENALPGIKTLQEGVAVYLKFYTEKEVAQYGVVAFTLA